MKPLVTITQALQRFPTPGFDPDMAEGQEAAFQVCLDFLEGVERMGRTSLYTNSDTVVKVIQSSIGSFVYEGTYILAAAVMGFTRFQPRGEQFRAYFNMSGPSLQKRLAHYAKIKPPILQPRMDVPGPRIVVEQIPVQQAPPAETASPLPSFLPPLPTPPAPVLTPVPRPSLYSLRPRRSAKVIEQARALFSDGYTHADIARQTGIPIHTIARWSSRGKWKFRKPTNAVAKFHIITADDVQQLATNVETALQLGWKLHGPVFAAKDGRMCQPLTNEGLAA